MNKQKHTVHKTTKSWVDEFGNRHTKTVSKKVTDKDGNVIQETFFEEPEFERDMVLWGLLSVLNSI